MSTPETEVQNESSVQAEPAKNNRKQSAPKKDDLTKLGVFLINKDLEIPKFQTEQSACFDLSANILPGTGIKLVDMFGHLITKNVKSNSIQLAPNERALIPTGMIFDIPEGYALEIYPRSGQSFKKGISLSNCTANIDSDYVQETFISVTNIGTQTIEIEHLERIAQAKLVKLVDTDIAVLNSAPKTKTSRNGGFGSTGK